MSAKQGTVNVVPTVWALGNIGGLSTSDTANMVAAYPASPMSTIPQLTDDGTHDASSNQMMKWYEDNVLNAVVNDGGHTFGEVSMQFNSDSALATPAPPTLGEAEEVGGGGWPASAFVPNPTSPGPGSVNPADQEAWAGTPFEPSDTPFNGVGSQLGVVESSAQQAGATLGSYGLGKSPYSAT
tara:strand:- start:11 stop:559 length:549 start_codon:yes stop_codon:yes gene_type:complete